MRKLKFPGARTERIALLESVERRHRVIRVLHHYREGKGGRGQAGIPSVHVAETNIVEGKGTSGKTQTEACKNDTKASGSLERS